MGKREREAAVLTASNGNGICGIRLWRQGRRQTER